MDDLRYASDDNRKGRFALSLRELVALHENYLLFMIF